MHHILKTGLNDCQALRLRQQILDDYPPDRHDTAVVIEKDKQHRGRWQVEACYRDA